jgi:hypothetical protein
VARAQSAGNVLVPPPGRLQLILQPTPEEVFEPDAVVEAPLIRFTAYSAHQRLFGWVRLDADRLTDLLNAHQELCLINVELEELPNRRLGTVDEVVVRQSDLVAVHARGPRGNEQHRRRTRLHPVAVQAGNYLIGGYLHVPPGTDPLLAVYERPPMIPLTDALIEYWDGGKRRHQSSGTIVVNRNATDWIRIVTHEDLIEGLPPPD